MKHYPSTGTKGGAVLKKSILVMGCLQFAFIGGCKREEIHAYRAPKETNTASRFGVMPTPQAPSGTMHQQESGADGVAWTVPPGWVETETTNAMRIATYTAPNGTEVAITAFPGDVGGLVANVNRWRGQVGLEPTDEQGMMDQLARLKGVDGVDVIIVDLQGDQRLIGTVINVNDGKTWFVKAMGESEIIEPNKIDIVRFSSTFHTHGENGEHGMNPAASTQPAAASTQSPIDWSKPEEWTAEANASSMLLEAYQSQSGARITMTSLLGDGGGVLGNVNRWRGQLGLPLLGAVDELDLVDLGNSAVSVDLLSTDGSSRMVAGIVPVGNQTLFFKLTGTHDAVETELARFDAYVQAYNTGRPGAP